MKSEIKITVIVPAYNIGKWLPRCIESILQQTYKKLEIIIIDDGSTDETGNIIDEYADLDSRIIPIHQKNLGLVSVREYGISIASGEYIGFVDGDDEIEEDMFERLLNNALQYNAEISQCGILYCFYDGRREAKYGTGKKYVFDTKDGYRELLQGTRIEPSLCNKLYKKEILINSCLDKTIVNNEDLLRNSVLFNRAKKSVFEDFCGYHYWRREGSMSNNERVVQNNINILRARKLIMDVATSDNWKYAFGSYSAALISTYNSLIEKKEQDANHLKKCCIEELNQERKKISCLPRKLKCRVYAILYFPILYNFVYRVYKNVKYKIH